MNGRNHFRDGSRGVTFETEDAEVTVACASGYAGSSHLEMYEYRMQLLLPDEDYSLVEITTEESICTCYTFILLCLCIEQSRNPEQMSETSGAETEEDDGDGMRVCDSSRSGVRSSRKRPKRQPPARENVKVAEAKEERLMLENVPNRADVAQEETTEPSISILVRFLIIIIFLFVVLLYRAALPALDPAPRGLLLKLWASDCCGIFPSTTSLPSFYKQPRELLHNVAPVPASPVTPVPRAVGIVRSPVGRQPVCSSAALLLLLNCPCFIWGDISDRSLHRLLRQIWNCRINGDAVTAQGRD
ncbi:hypothetical protein AV530_004398 [Patagioenas fasciata monilis]|uniref:Uncharacterized protein n=1 Tax=Patagioenas fasciata monilis TaxID=372326 RepID=A0A1V4J1W6_PATFA|nr:hypothetical protein AV530_004398 [Patagioenas fasciata monilis]